MMEFFTVRLTKSFRLVGLALLGLVALNQADAAKKPNILWIVGENFSLDLACYGQKNVSTPNLDRLAREGTRYTKVYSTSPVCAPSRSALMTGWYATTTDMHHMRSHRSDGFRLPAGVRPITHLLRDAGYHTANITHIGERVVGTGKLDLNFAKEGPVYAGRDWAELKKKQPFFAQINMPEAEYDIYDRKSAEKPRVKWVGEEWHPKVATPENVTPPPYYPDHKITREEWARYLNSVTGTDVRIGWILDQLKQDGLSENTIVIFFADNGRLDARGIHWCWDSGLHVPMIIRWPRNVAATAQITPGRVDEQVLSLLDLSATTLWMSPSRSACRAACSLGPTPSRRAPMPSPRGIASTRRRCASAPCTTRAFTTSATTHPAPASPRSIVTRRNVFWSSRSCAAFMRRANSPAPPPTS